MKGYNAGGWVAARAKHLNMGGMVPQAAGMQAYKDMETILGKGMPPNTMMPQGAPMPEEFKMNPKKAEELRKQKAFDNSERRKEEMHQLSMKQKTADHVKKQMES